jgi:hypothetical protein
MFLSFRRQLSLQEWGEQGECSSRLVCRNHMSSSSDCCKYQTLVPDNITTNLTTRNKTKPVSESYMQTNILTIFFYMFLCLVHPHTWSSSEYHDLHDEFVGSPRMSREYSVEVTGQTESVSPLKGKRNNFLLGSSNQTGLRKVSSIICGPPV